MNNPSPLVPQGSLLDQKNKGRARVKIAVFVVLAIHGIGLLALLMQGCQQKESAPPTAETNNVAPPSFVEPTNAPVVEPSNTTSMTTTGAPVVPPAVEPVVPPTTLPSATEYKVAQGDSFSTIARKFHVTVKAIAEANPGVDSSKLKIGQTLHIPAPTPSATTGSSASNGVTTTGELIYTVKSGDTLTKIAAQQGISLRALRTLNGLKTDSIKVGQKLKIPAKTTSTAPTAAPIETTPAVPSTISNSTSVPETR